MAGHRLQGMVGQIIVGDATPPDAMDSDTMNDTMMDDTMEDPIDDTTSDAMDSATPVEYDGVISVPAGSALPGCDETDECYIPYNVSVSVGDLITWSNDDAAAHTVTSGIPSEGPDGNFDSGLFVSGSTFEWTPTEAGQYPYFCLVHPWMIGNISVN